MNTNIKIITLVIIIATYCTGFLVGMAICKSQIDLPEEHTQISVNINKPDTLTCYRIEDKLYFQFVPKP